MTEFASQRPLVHAVLEDNGYSRLTGSFEVGDIRLDLDDCWLGAPGNLDLAVVAARPQSRAESSQLYWAIQRLVRALEAAESQRTITIILLGDAESSSPEMRRAESELQTLSRVLIVDPDVAVERSLAPLLKLELPFVSERELDGVSLVEQEIVGRRRAGELLTLLKAAKDGPRAVEAQYYSWIDRAFSSRSAAN